MDFAAKVAAGFKANPLKVISVKEWDETVYFRPMTLAEAQAIEGERRDTEKAFELLFLKLLDENGKRLFTEKATARVALLENTSLETINMIASTVAPLDTIEDAKNV